MASATLYLGLGLSAVVLLVVTNYRVRARKRLSFPPGPKGLPFFGNAFQYPEVDPWEQFAQWEKEYGDVVGLSLFGQNVVIINKHGAASDLLEKRSSIYSNRPQNALWAKYGGWDFAVTAANPGEFFKLERRFLSQFFNTSAVKQYFNLLTKNTRRYVTLISTDPTKFRDWNRMTTAANILSAAYGHEVTDENDEWVQRTDQAMRSIGLLGTIGTHPIDIIPSREFWNPECGQLFYAEQWTVQKCAREMSVLPFQLVKEQVLTGTAIPSITSTLIESHLLPDGSVKHEREIYGSAAVVYMAGADTTVSSIDSFILAMMLFPEVQKRAQKYIDELLQGERLPDLEDRDSLPYLSAIVKEALRWQPIVPLGLAHCLAQDDTYRNYHLPADTMIIPNLWKMLRDPDEFPEPEKFKPERFIDTQSVPPSLRTDVRDPEEMAWGFGKRICPGRHFAYATLWITFATLLTVFDISLPKDEAGNDILPDLKYVNGIVIHPKPFECIFKPRSDHALSLLQTTNDLQEGAE
ncbi:cytochrome P450 [Sistotremastrum suecicum HHB10207 ss-3]|uniref:Cytochrome P450 n=1 Tax=Sistotremastrum suecicum HHB10207 ss-3 TaxID=1314776 RepID=A0A166BUW9_9AGAM|nr:cytochrome P450 [Sistotremastrum suecicum HHB10207 ss-3]